MYHALPHERTWGFSLGSSASPIIFFAAPLDDDTNQIIMTIWPLVSSAIELRPCLLIVESSMKLSGLHIHIHTTACTIYSSKFLLSSQVLSYFRPKARHILCATRVNNALGLVHNVFTAFLLLVQEAPPLKKNNIFLCSMQPSLRPSHAIIEGFSVCLLSNIVEGYIL